MLNLDVAWEAAAQHSSGAGLGGPGANRQGQWIGLKVSDPDGVEPLVEYSERGKKSSHRYGHVGVGYEIQLGIVNALQNLAMK